MKYETWIDEDNLRPILVSIGWVNGYKFDNLDWDAVRFGVKNVDEDNGVWYDYAMLGEFEIKVSISMMIGSCNYSLIIECVNDIRKELEIISGMGQRYKIQDF